MRLILHLFLVLLAGAAQAGALRGNVVDSVSGKPLPNASVFINNTSIGTTTDENGNFVITAVPAGEFELVISYVGYETATQWVPGTVTDPLKIKLVKKDATLENVVVTAYEKNGWERWGFLFTNTFLGNSALADHCKIKNTGDIRFSFSQSRQVLTAFSVKPLIIINKDLGYQIEYDLVKFSFDFSSKYLIIGGYPLFRELPGNDRKKKRWAKNRQLAYEGSLMRFMRALYEGKTEESGYTIRRLLRKPNREKQRVKFILNNSYNHSGFPADTLRYYHRVMDQNDYIDVLYSQPLKWNDIARREGNTISFQFNDYLYITRSQQKEAPEYYLRNNGNHPDSCITSMMTLEKPEPLSVSATGAFNVSLNLTLVGYWGWWEKITTMLPLDYRPESQQQATIRK